MEWWVGGGARKGACVNKTKRTPRPPLSIHVSCSCVPLLSFPLFLAFSSAPWRHAHTTQKTQRKACMEQRGACCCSGREHTLGFKAVWASDDGTGFREAGGVVAMRGPFPVVLGVLRPWARRHQTLWSHVELCLGVVGLARDGRGRGGRDWVGPTVVLSPPSIARPLLACVQEGGALLLGPKDHPQAFRGCGHSRRRHVPLLTTHPCPRSGAGGSWWPAKARPQDEEEMRSSHVLLLMPTHPHPPTPPWFTTGTATMSGKKIVKPKGQEPDEWDNKVAAELLALEVRG